MKDFLISKFPMITFPMITDDRQIQAMDGNLQSSGLKAIVSGPFEPTFYKNATWRICQFIFDNQKI